MFAIFLCYGLISTEYQALIICAATHLATLAIVVVIYPMQVERALLFSVGMVSGQLTMFTFAAFTHRRLQFVNQQKLEAAYAIGTKVAHEIRTPLLTIRNLVRAAELNLEEQNSAGVPSSNNEQIHDKLKKIAHELTYANTTIDMLLVSSSAAPFNYDKAETTDIENCVHQAVEAYPYANTSEKSRITIQNGTNFRAIAPSRLILSLIHI